MRRITKAQISAYAAELGRLGGINQPREAKARGGRATAAKLTPEERREKGRKAGLASAALLTPRQRIERARRAGLANQAARREHAS